LIFENDAIGILKTAKNFIAKNIISKLLQINYN